MAKPNYSTGVSSERHRELMRSAEARAERRQERLAELPVFIGMALRGRIRETGEAVLPPQVIPADLIVALGKRLSREPILRDDFTNKLPTFLDKYPYDQYAMGGNKNNKRKETQPEEIDQAKMARRRQTKHIVDKLHHNTWQQWQLARVFRASMEHIRGSLAAGSEPKEEALLVASSAIEDFGYCLQGNHRLRTMTHGRMLPHRLVQIGQYGADYPQSLLAQDPTLFLLVQREQEKREELWGDNLSRYEQPDWGGMLRSRQDLRDEAINDALMTNWHVE